ncbi:hypothetical protein AMELA_G00208620 [Ameiurus melas]|uniref:Uncharacterized protein n=1 Tax=Ameiurus melas TaxID=219545 RepID=A0A7J6A3P4_AMEME|nr:hypothetical protein AMELA_G00208620 [Ameiurus melas]
MRARACSSLLHMLRRRGSPWPARADLQAGRKRERERWRRRLGSPLHPRRSGANRRKENRGEEKRRRDAAEGAERCSDSEELGRSRSHSRMARRHHTPPLSHPIMQ